MNYTPRRHGMARAIARLAEVAGLCHDALATGDWDGLAAGVREAWSLNQALDPHCSNPQVDALLGGHRGAWKLVGAGGGGFAVLLRDADDAPLPPGARAVPWRLHLG